MPLAQTQGWVRRVGQYGRSDPFARWAGWARGGYRAADPALGMAGPRGSGQRRLLPNRRRGHNGTGFRTRLDKVSVPLTSRPPTGRTPATGWASMRTFCASTARQRARGARVGGCAVSCRNLRWRAVGGSPDAPWRNNRSKT